MHALQGENRALKQSLDHTPSQDQELDPQKLIGAVVTHMMQSLEQ